MKIFFDTEFIEDGRTIDLLSIGMVREDGAVYYAELDEADHSKAGPWVREHVLPFLSGRAKPRDVVAEEIRHFVGSSPQFWANYAAYDWVALCQLYGPMISIPGGWPMYCRDFQQFLEQAGLPAVAVTASKAHNALDDALALREAYMQLV